jgi:Trypsin-like peptidase domain
MLCRLLMIASVLIACFAWQALAQDTACIYNAHQAAVVRIEYQYDAGADGASVVKGSGFIISPTGHVITADHVVRPPIKNVTLKSDVTLVRPGVDSFLDDLALLQLPVRPDGSSWPFVTVSDITTLAVGTPLMGLGFGSSEVLAVIPWGEKTANNVIVDGRLKPWWRSSLALILEIAVVPYLANLVPLSALP